MDSGTKTSGSSPGEAVRAEDLNRPKSSRWIRNLRGCYVIKTGLNAFMANEHQGEWTVYRREPCSLTPPVVVGRKRRVRWNAV